jgi:uncharacterized RDD family membrane protein YckC
MVQYWRENMDPSGQPGPAGGNFPDRDATGSAAPPPASPTTPPTWQESPTPPPAAPPAAGSWTGNLTSTAPVAGPAGYYYADVPNRLIAYIIDAIILGIIYLVVSIVLAAVVGPAQRFNPTQDNPLNFEVNYAAALVGAVINTAISAAYFIYTWTTMRGTPGMRVLGIQVGNESDGATLTTNQALTRWILLGGPLGLVAALNPIPALGALIVLALIVWFIALLVTTAQSPTKQGLHDRYAKTVVVKAARAVA